MKNRLDKFSFIFMCIIIVISIIPNITYANPTQSQSNVNTPSNWAIVAIEGAKESELIPEELQGQYRNSISREEFSELAMELYEALGGKKTTPPEVNPFSDTQNAKVLIANKLGIIHGKEDGKFDPKSKVTREEMSVMLYRTLKAAKPGYKYPDLEGYIFTDNDIISSWAKEAVSYLYGVEVINGVGDNQFNPKGDASREQAIILVKKTHEKVAESEIAQKNNLVVSRGARSKESIIKLKLKKYIAEEMGKPYQWGGTGPDGYDCSGLVYSLFGKLGISLPRTSKTQAGAGTYVSKEELIYGDLVFFARDGKNINHVGIYVGDGEFVHSPQTGDVVKTTTLMSGYYARGYYTARRVIK